MKKIIIFVLTFMPLVAFNVNDHIVPDTEHGQYSGASGDPGGNQFVNDPQSNNFFDDPNWPNTKGTAKYNHPDTNSYPVTNQNAVPETSVTK